MKRRDFLLRSATLTASGLLLHRSSAAVLMRVPDERPEPSRRRFTSQAVEDTLIEVSASIPNPELRRLFLNCYPNTLDTTVFFSEENGVEDTFIITGDIDAMWLRDSTAQVWPYLSLVKKDEALKKLIRGLINRQAACVLLDPYANSFYRDASRPSDWASDQPSPQPGVHERKWEIDSLCYVIRLAYGYWKTSGDTTPFGDSWKKAMQTLVQTFRTEQRRKGLSPYRFKRLTSAMEDAPVHEGTGRPTRYTGMIHSMFRPSDDATLYPFSIPSNLFAAQALRQLEEMARIILKDSVLAQECNNLASEVEAGIRKYGQAMHPVFGEIYAYEVDGFGNGVFMDDANVPSLLSLAYLGIHKPTDEIYSRTREFVLSPENPWFLKGQAGEGNGSPHTGKENIWPMSIIMRAFTSQRDEEILFCLKQLLDTHAGTYFIHESFHKDDPYRFTRSWFAWANTLLGELIVKLYHEKPYLLKSI
ncbi:MAG: glycoside hydrolase family 125 protein [Bacteroidales bacterium]